MKTLFHCIPLAAVLCVSLFFACSSDLELPVSPDKLVMCAYEEEKVCGPLDNGKCHDGGKLVQACPYGSSNSGDGSSSSGGGGSSSSIGGSSSSGGASSSSGNYISPEIEGDFKFRHPDYDSSSIIYYLGTNNMYVSATPSSEGGLGKLYNSPLKITNADEAGCGDITIEVTGLEGLTTMPTRTEAPATVSQPGKIIAYAVAICAGKKDTLRIDSATVVPDPTFSECIFPSTYVWKDEHLVEVNNTYGRCTDATYSPAAYTVGQTSIIASCGTHTKTCSLPGVIVATNHIKLNSIDTQRELFSTGTTVIELLDDYDGKVADKFACGTKTGTPQFKLNNGALQSVGSWKEVQISAYPPDYRTNGNRVLVEITGGTAECLIATWP